MQKTEGKKRAANNRTLVLEQEERDTLKAKLVTEEEAAHGADIVNKTLNGDTFRMRT